MIYFSDFFNVDASKIEEYGAFNISLINDLPLFVDPFGLFGSEKEEYQRLHEEILEYIKFLRDKSQLGTISKAQLKSWYFFKEVKQNWFGYSLVGNSGRGLEMEFAKNFSSTLSVLFSNIGSETITESSHIEKACLIQSGVGKDQISDFSTNLIKKYLLDYTEKFAQEYLEDFQLRRINVPKVYFNYKLEKWMSKEYNLPYISDDYIILTPRDLLTKDENWINRHDLDGDFEDICNSIDNDQLRFEIQNYFQISLPAPEPDRKPSKRDTREAITKVIRKYPEILDFYIKTKEEDKAEAKNIVNDSVEIIQSIFIDNIIKLVPVLYENGFYNESYDSSYESIKTRLLLLRNVIQEKKGYKAFFHDGHSIKNESELQLIQKLLWYASPRISNNDYESNFSKININRGNSDKNKFSFKLASNSKLKQYLSKHVTPEKKENQEEKDQLLLAIFYFDDRDLGNITSLLNELNMNNNKNIVLIDAGRRNENRQLNEKKVDFDINFEVPKVDFDINFEVPKVDFDIPKLDFDIDKDFL